MRHAGGEIRREREARSEEEARTEHEVRIESPVCIIQLSNFHGTLNSSLWRLQARRPAESIQLPVPPAAGRKREVCGRTSFPFRQASTPLPVPNNVTPEKDQYWEIPPSCVKMHETMTSCSPYARQWEAHPARTEREYQKTRQIPRNTKGIPRRRRAGLTKPLVEKDGGAGEFV